MGPRAKAFILVAIIVVATVAVFVVDIPDPQPLREQVRAAGLWGVLLFALVYAGVSLTPFPASALTIGGGLLFGLAVGSTAVMLGATTGAWLGFSLARVLGRDGVARIGWSSVASVDAVLQRRGLVSMMIIRLIPLPFALVNYAAGLSAVRTRDYLVGTAVGIVPSTVGYAAVGAYGTSPTSWPFILAVVVVAVLGVGSSVVGRRVTR
ncbi:TVP38/TMEM64 family protein [Williamsia sp. CHRR-6]|nr:TVP38/TMEM64 family protein [Williamsia sp. CHRR-6]